MAQIRLFIDTQLPCCTRDMHEDVRRSVGFDAKQLMMIGETIRQIACLADVDRRPRAINNFRENVISWNCSEVGPDRVFLVRVGAPRSALPNEIGIRFW